MTNRKPIAVCGILLLAGGIVLAQQAPPSARPSSGSLGVVPSSVLVHPAASGSGTIMIPQPLPTTATPMPAASRKPDEMTIDQLLDAIEQVRGQKAELEKCEAELVKAAKAKVTAQKSRLEKLGVVEAQEKIPNGGEPTVPPIPAGPQQ